MAGRGAVVVGGSRGVGLAVAKLLAVQGAGVAINGRDPDMAREAAQRVTADGGRAIDHVGSPAEPSIADDLVDACVQEFGRIDIL